MESEDEDDFDLFDDIKEVLTEEESQQKRIDDIMNTQTENDNALIIPP